MLIDNEQSARRLARAIASDVALYQAAAVAEAQRGMPTPPDLTTSIDEGRALYVCRVVPAFHGLFTQAIDELVFKKRPSNYTVK